MRGARLVPAEAWQRHVAQGNWTRNEAGEALIEKMPRGRIELPTPAFSGQRSTTELPRPKLKGVVFVKSGIIPLPAPKCRLQELALSFCNMISIEMIVFGESIQVEGR